MNYDEKIKELKIELPEAKAPVGSYVATKISGNLLYVSGQISIQSANRDRQNDQRRLTKTSETLPTP